MKNRLILLSLLCIAYPLSGYGQAPVYKCAIEGSVVYQDMPCEAGQTSIARVGVRVENLEPSSASPAVLKPEHQPQPLIQQSPIQLTNLVLGMTDTEVLNLRGWGRPSKITRGKANRVWLEEWTYASPADGPKLLQFANGRLTALRTEPVVTAPQQIVQITPQ